MRTVLAAAAQPSGGVEALGVPGGGESRGREAPKPGPGTRGLNDIAASVTSEPQDKARPRREDARNRGERGARSARLGGALHYWGREHHLGASAMPPQLTRHHMNAHECGRSPFAITQRPGRRSQPRPQRACGYPLATRDHRRVDHERIVRRSDALSQHRITPPQPRAACGSEATATADIEILGRPVGESCRTSRCNAHSCSAPGVRQVLAGHRDQTLRAF